MSNVVSLKKERLIRGAAVTGIILICALIILKIENMLVSFVLAFAISNLLSPFANYLERAGLPRSLCVSSMFLFIAVLLGAGTFIMLPGIAGQLASLKHELPRYIEGTTKILAMLENNLNSFVGSFYQVDISKTAEQALFSFSKQIFSNLPRIFSSSLTVMILAPFFAFFLLLNGRHIVKQLLEMVPNNLFELALNLQHQISVQIGGFIRARLLEAGIVGLVVWIGLIIISFPYALLLAVFAALTNLLPYLGPVIGAVPAVLIALVNGMGVFEIACLVSVYAAAQLVDNIFVIPLVVARIVNLHAVTALIVIIIGAQAGGILGMIISIPVASIIKLTSIAVYQQFIDFRI